MKNTLVCKILTLAVAGGMLLSATAALAQGASDSFNRPHFNTNWVVVSGSLGIANHQMVGASGSIGYLKTSHKDTAASVVVSLNSTDLEYGAVALGKIAGGGNAFVKIQAQDGTGTFGYGGFYTANNVGGTFFQLASPVPTPATLDVFFCGTVATMRITSAAGIQTYTNDYGTTFGAGGGLGTYGSVGLDNYVGFPGGCNHSQVGIPASKMPKAKDLSLGK